MSYQERQGLIRQIETLRESRVITLVTGDRNIAQTQIADDCLKPLYDLLVGIRDSGCPNKIDLFLETRGGSVETPWKLVNKIRQFCNRFTVIIPWKAYSAGTMIC
jgi:ATP-dependent protease ClpP protease subunit